MATPRFHFPGTALLQTRRLGLRQLTLDDADELLQLGREPRVSTHLLDAPLNTPQQVEAMVLWMNLVYAFGKPAGLGNWRADDSEGRFVGLFSLMGVDQQGDSEDVELGARLLPEFWNLGYAVEGGRALCDYAFTTLALPRLLGLCDPAHASVPSVLGRLGFEDRGERLHFGRPARMFVLDQARWQVTRSA